MSANVHRFCTLLSLSGCLAWALGSLLLAGCGGGKGDDVAKAIARASPVCADGSFHRLGSAKIAYAAIVRSQAAVSHTRGGAPFARFGRLNVNGVPTIFSVRGTVVDARCAPRALLVQVPRRPNGTTGWVAASEVDVATVRTRIVVDLSERRLTLYEAGRPVLTSAVAIGSPATPTPVGRFYVNQRIVPTDPAGPFGPGAIGISAFSNVLTGWTQGGPIAIHGTDAPSSIGEAVSNGCIRLPNETLRRVFAQALAGTPVDIRR